jgi:Spy/CpxP family protein refolding chaperone
MNFFRKNTIIIWILSAMLIITLSALGTMIFHDKCKRLTQQETKDCGMRCNLLTEELGLSESQAKSVDMIRARHRQATMATADSLRFSRSALVTELGRETPDTLRLRQLSRSIGGLQTQLVDQTIDQYLRIRKECTPEQQEKLSSLYYELMGCCPAGEGKQMLEQCRRMR